MKLSDIGWKQTKAEKKETDKNRIERGSGEKGRGAGRRTERGEGRLQEEGEEQTVKNRIGRGEEEKGRGAGKRTERGEGRQ